MFIQQNRLKLKLRSGQVAAGIISSSDDAQLAELFGLAGFDYCILDAEHGLLHPDRSVSVIRACELTGMTPWYESVLKTQSWFCNILMPV